jgi:hypothetical protein
MILERSKELTPFLNLPLFPSARLKLIFKLCLVEVADMVKRPLQVRPFVSASTYCGPHVELDYTTKHGLNDTNSAPTTRNSSETEAQLYIPSVPAQSGRTITDLVTLLALRPQGSDPVTLDAINVIGYSQSLRWECCGFRANGSPRACVVHGIMVCHSAVQTPYTPEHEALEGTKLPETVATVPGTIPFTRILSFRKLPLPLQNAQYPS